MSQPLSTRSRTPTTTNRSRPAAVRRSRSPIRCRRRAASSSASSTASATADVELRFSGEVFYWRGPAPYHYVTVPERPSAEISAVAAAVTYGWGVIPVTAHIGETSWETSLFPKDGLYLVPLKVRVRTAEEIELGDVVTITLEIST